MSLRIGIGYDVHRLTSDRPLVLGGVTIPYHLGLAGHSDADALLHAMTDAILGALSLGDIGKHFPDDDPKWKNQESILFLQEAQRMTAERGYQIANFDSTIIAQAPKLGKHIDQMRTLIAKHLNLEIDQVGIKATTHEKIGTLGRGEGIAAQAVVLLTKP